MSFKMFFIQNQSWVFKNYSFNSMPQGLIPKAKEFLGLMKQQGSKGDTKATSLTKIILAHTESFKHFSILSQEFLNSFLEDKL